MFMSDRDSYLDRNPIKIESGVHGLSWQKLHDGYFSDPAVARPFIEAVKRAIDASKPRVIVDLGGGTGFLLRELIKRSIDPAIGLVNLDLSRKQLAVARGDHIITVSRSIIEFRRKDASKEKARFLFMMRSALHYLGRDGIMPFLCHLRAQTRKGEFFIHQTACFDKAGEARYLNRLYALMGTEKWYPTTKYLHECLESAGWSITASVRAPMLPLTSKDLGKRYRLSKHRLEEIRGDLLKNFGEKENIFRLVTDGFCAYLHYRIFTCAAK